MLPHLSLFHPSSFDHVTMCLSAPVSTQSNAQTHRWHLARLDMDVEAEESVNTGWKHPPSAAVKEILRLTLVPH